MPGMGNDKPKNVSPLQKDAEQSQREYGRVTERKVLGENEQECKEFGDMEAFLCSSYCKRLEKPLMAMEGL